jgi:hypothetical protein
MKKILTIVPLCILAVPAFAQTSALQREEIKKLSFLLGEWKGEGWIMTPDGKRKEFIQTEKVQPKLDGVGLLIEGQGIDKASNQVAFEAIAVVFYDERGKVYRMHSGTNDGRSGDGEMKLIDGGLQWQPLMAGGRVRYTMRLTEKGQWHEVGEFSADGTNWRQFHEMKLEKVR